MRFPVIGTAMLSGIYTYNVDGKGRIVMPGRFLDALGNPFVLAGDSAGCLVAAPRTLPFENRSGVRGYVECCIKDRNGRFVVPNALREYAGLTQSDEAAVIGAGESVEIWNRRRWEAQARAPFPPNGPRAAAPLSVPMTDPAPPSPFPTAPGVLIRQKALYGQPYLEVEGALSLSETDRVLARLETALRGRPRTLFLDLRGVDTVDASFLLALEPLVAQMAAHGGRMAILTERADVAALVERLCGHRIVRVFTNLESGLWWLVDEGHA